jgi:transposase
LGASVFAAALTEAYLRREYLEGGRSVRELATEVGCTDKTVTRYLRCHGIPRREGPPLGLDREQLSRWFVDEGRGIAEIAGRAGCSARAVRTLLARWDVRRTVAPMSTAALRDAYVGQGRSTTDIAAQLGCAPATVARRLRSAGIPLRRPGGAHLPRARWPEAGIRPGLLPADR